MSAPVIRRTPTHRGVVVAALSLTPRMRRVTVRTAAMEGTLIRPAQDVELMLREASGRRVKRRYTIRHARLDAGELDLDVLLHGEGPGSSWGAHARAGDEIEFQGPRGKLQLRSAPWHLLVGDESALPAIAAITEALPPGERALPVIEVQDADDELRPAEGARWVHRGSQPPGTAQHLLPVIESMPLPVGDGHAYLMGETRTMVALRAVLESRGMAHDAIFVKGYWNIGRPDRLANRPPSGPGAGGDQRR